MKFLILLIIITLNQVINANKDKSNIVLSGGSGGCCNGGNGALVMQNGRKGKKNEKLIIKDDALIMQNGKADGNIIMDGNNLIFNEGKKSENIVIKGNGGQQCCNQDIHHKEEHISSHPIAIPIPIHLNAEPTHEHRTYVPVPVHFKKKEVHHHHTKEVHHHNDNLGLGSRRKDANNDTEIDYENFSFDEEESKKKHHQNSSKRKSKSKKFKIRKLNLGDKLSLKEKEHLKLKRVDRRLGLSRFRLAGKVMKKIKFKRRKNSKKSNKDDDDKSKDDDKQESNGKEGNSGQDNEQYEEEDEEDNGKDQEDENNGNQNLFNGLANAFYHPNAAAALNPIAAVQPISTGYIPATGLNGMIDLYPSQVLVPQALNSVSDRRDLNKKKNYENFEKERNLRKIKNLENNVKKYEEDQQKSVQSNGDIKEDNESEEFDNNNIKNTDENEFLKMNNDKFKDLKSKINHQNENSISKTINQTSITSSLNSMFNKNFLRPIYALDERQLTPSLASLLALTTNVQQRLSIPHTTMLNGPQTATLPLFTPARSMPNTGNSNSLDILLPLIARQSQHQQQLIRAQRQKLIEQEVKQKELTMQLQQATEQNKENKERGLKKNYFKEELVGKSYLVDDLDDLEDRERFKEREKSRLLYENDQDYWDKLNDESRLDKLKRLDRETLKRLRRRKSEEESNNQYDKLEHNRSNDILNTLIKKEKNQLLRLQQQRAKAESNDEFDFSDFDEELRTSSSMIRNNKLKIKDEENKQQTFAKRMMSPEEPKTEESKLIANVTNFNNKTDKDNNGTERVDYNVTASDSKPSSYMNEIKLAKNASLIVYGY